MAKTQHTHNGTCQACGRQHAVDNTKRTVAKHGYTVDMGCFHGVCPGGRSYKPAEFDVSYTHQMIVLCGDRAKALDQHAEATRKGEYVPPTFERWNKNKSVTKRGRHGSTYTSHGGYDTLPLEQATPDERKRRIEGEIHQAEQHAEMNRDHARFLVREVLPRYGKALYPAEAKREYSKGMHLVSDGTEIVLTRVYYSTFGSKRLGWYAHDAKDEKKREFRYTVRQLNAARVKP